MTTLLSASEETFGNASMYRVEAVETLLASARLSIALDEKAVVIETADEWIARVAPNALGRGLGSTILARVESELRSRASAARVQWTPRHDDRATRLLIKAGWISEYIDLQMSIETGNRSNRPRPDVEITPGTTSDQIAVHDLICRAWDVEPHYGRFLQRFVTVPGYDPSLWLLAREGADLVGCAIGATSEDEVGIVRHLDVHPSHRRRGIGTALLDELLLRFEQRGIQRAQLGVHADNPSRAAQLYRSLGWEIVSEQQKWRSHAQRAL